jgi:hypothetical protein
MDFLKIKENLNKLKKTGEDLTAYLKESINIEMVRSQLLENSSERIVYKLKELDYKVLDRKDFSKIVLLMRYLDQNDLDEYRTYFKETYNTEELQERPEKPEDVSKESISKYNEELKLWNKSIDKTKEWNRNYKFIIDSLNDTITLDLYGDITLNSADLTSVYFKFYETNVSDMEVFIQEIRNSPSESVQNIKKVTIVDISSQVPNEISSAHEVSFYFEDGEEATLFRENESVAYGVYEKFIIRNDTMKKVGGEWGLDFERKQNFSASNPFANPTSVPTHNVKSDNSISTMDIFEDDYEVSIEDCIYSEKVHEDGSMVFVIQPSEFFEEFETILTNPKLVINGITDDNNWDKREDGSYSYRKGYSKALEFLEENSQGYNEKLDDIVIQVEESIIETLTEYEMESKYIYGSSNFKPYDLYFDFQITDGDNIIVFLNPKGFASLDYVIKLSRDVYGDMSLERFSECMFSINVGERKLQYEEEDVIKAYNFLIGIGMRPRTEDLLEETLEEL